MCRAICGKLILPVSSKENREVYEFITANNIRGDTGIWLRISDEYKEGTWRDSYDQSKLVGFTHWRKTVGEPNNYGGIEHYGMLNTEIWRISNGAESWNDNPDNRKYYVVCEFA